MYLEESRDNIKIKIPEHIRAMLSLYKVKKSFANRVCLLQGEKEPQFIVVKQSRTNMRLDEHKIKQVLQLNHPNILPFIGWWNKEYRYIQSPQLGGGEINCIAYTITEYVRCADLDSILQKRKSLPIKYSLKIVKEIARVLTYVYKIDKDLAFFPLTPKKILIEQDTDVILVRNIGIFQAIEDLRPNCGGDKYDRPVLDIPIYFANEQIAALRNRKIKMDYYTTIYYLGAMLFHLITGQTPLKRMFENFCQKKSIVQIYRAFIERRFTPLHKVMTDVPQDIAFIIKKATADDMEKRFQTFDSFCEAILEVEANYC